MLRGVVGGVPAGKGAVDGLYCQLVQRKVSGPLSPWFARRMGPNTVTALGLGVGAAAGTASVLGTYLIAAVLIQVFGVLSCVDGEVARIRKETSAAGDFFDTMADRLVEVVVIVAMAGAAFREGRSAALAAGLCLVGIVLLLVVSSEKYRSAFGTGYPKRVWERPFSAVSAGSDGRLLVLSCGLVMAAFVDSGAALETVLWVLSAVGGLNLIWRSAVLVHKLRRPISVRGERNIG